MAKQEIARFVSQMHPVAFAVAKEVAIGTIALAHPLAVAKGSKAILPYVHKIVLVDIALLKVTADTGTGRNCPICQDGTHRNPCATSIEVIAYIAFVPT